MIQRARRQLFQRLYNAVVFKFFILWNVEKWFRLQPPLQLHIDTGERNNSSGSVGMGFFHRSRWIAVECMEVKNKKSSERHFALMQHKTSQETPHETNTSWVCDPNYVLSLLSLPMVHQFCSRVQTEGQVLCFICFIAWRNFPTIGSIKVFFIPKGSITDFNDRN